MTHDASTDTTGSAGDTELDRLLNLALLSQYLSGSLCTCEGYTPEAIVYLTHPTPYGRIEP